MSKFSGLTDDVRRSLRRPSDDAAKAFASLRSSSVGEQLTELGEYIGAQRRSAEMSLRQLAEQAGVSNPYLSQIERGLRKPSAEVLQQLAKALRVSAETLYVRAGILDPAEHPVHDVTHAIVSDPAITERQKQVLIDIYTSFVNQNAAEEEAEETGARLGTPLTPAGRATAAKTASARKAAAKQTEADGTAPTIRVAEEAQPVKKAPAKNAPAKKAAAKKTPAKKAAAKKAPAKKAPAKKTPAKKAAATQTTAKKTTAKKSAAKKAPATSTAAKKTAAKKTTP